MKVQNSFVKNILNNARINISTLTVILIGIMIGFVATTRVSHFIIAIVIGGIFFLVSVKNIKLAIIVLAMYVPLEEWLLKWAPRGGYEMARFGWEFLLLFLLLSVLLGKIINEGRIVKTPIDGLLFIFLGVASVSMLSNWIPISLGILGLRTLLRYVLLYYLIINISLEEEFIKKLLKAMVFIIVFQWIVSLLQRFVGGGVVRFFAPKEVVQVGSIIFAETSGIWEKGAWVFGTMKRYNLLGNFLSFFILIVTGCYFTKERRKRKLFWFILVSSIILLLTYSRTSWIGLYVGVVLILFVTKKRKLLLFFLLGPVILTLILWTVYAQQIFVTKVSLGEMSLTQRYLRMFTGRYIRTSYQVSRLAVLTKVSREVISKKPLFGFGPGIVEYREVEGLGEPARRVLQQIEVAPIVIHFLGDVGWTSILVQFGSIGALIWVSIVLVVLRISIKLYRVSENRFIQGIGLGYAGAVVAIIVENFFCYNFTYRAVSFYFWLFGGIVVHLWMRERKRAKIKVI